MCRLALMPRSLLFILAVTLVLLSGGSNRLRWELVGDSVGEVGVEGFAAWFWFWLARLGGAEVDRAGLACGLAGGEDGVGEEGEAVGDGGVTRV